MVDWEPPIRSDLITLSHVLGPTGSSGGHGRESLAKIREGLSQRKREREKSQNWFESWFNSSPWFATLISSLVGPLIILLLLLTFRPCLLNKLVAFIKSHINMVQLMVLRSQYAALPMVPLAGDNTELTSDP